MSCPPHENEHGETGMDENIELRLQVLEEMADTQRAYALVTRHLWMALARDVMERSDDGLALIDRMRTWLIDAATPDADRRDIETHLALLEAKAPPPRQN